MEGKNKTNLLRLLAEPLPRKTQLALMTVAASSSEIESEEVLRAPEGSCLRNGLDSPVRENRTVLLLWGSYGSLPIEYSRLNVDLELHDWKCSSMETSVNMLVCDQI